jgi:hypothetical protein
VSAEGLSATPESKHAAYVAESIGMSRPSEELDLHVFISPKNMACRVEWCQRNGRALSFAKCQVKPYKKNTCGENTNNHSLTNLGFTALCVIWLDLSTRE